MKNSCIVHQWTISQIFSLFVKSAKICTAQFTIFTLICLPGVILIEKLGIFLYCVDVCNYINLLPPLAVHFRLLTEFNIHVHVNIKISNSSCQRDPRENLRAKDICY